MKLHEVKVIIKHTYDFFIENRIENVINNIPFQKLETRISEVNKFAIVTMKYDSSDFIFVVHPQRIQLHMKSLEDLKLVLKVFESFEENIKKQLQVDFVSFNGILRTPVSTETYNSVLAKEPSNRIKVKMLGIDVESSNYEYRVSLNKLKGFTKVHVKAFMQCSVEEVSTQSLGAFNEFQGELQQLKEIL